MGLWHDDCLKQCRRSDRTRQDRQAHGRLQRGCATRSLETYPKDRGMSGEDRGCLGIPFFDNCMFMRVQRNISYSRLPDERERAPSLGVGLANQGPKREGKPVCVESDDVTPASTWLWITKVKLYSKRRHAEPANADYGAARRCRGRTKR